MDDFEDAQPINQNFEMPEIANDLTGLNQEGGKILVTCGANQMYFEKLIGKTVKAVRKSLREIFNFTDESMALVHGREVDPEYVLAQGDWLEFIKEAGIKG